MKKPLNDFTKNEILELSSEFKRRRNYLNISQLKLSKLAGISQSIINKFENGKIDPTYSTILKIEKALEKEENISNLKAKNIMKKNIISITQKTKISQAIEIMRKNDFSQLLVFSNEILLGTVYEKNLYDAIFKKIDIYETDIKNYIENSPIIIPPNYPSSEINILFSNKKTKCILVGEKNNILGLITKSDIFK
ncbi:MAG: CBS domain-containing protein [Nanoarchaeota archaeon]|nr:CBS domain-containing protein [Nanoarchaeota archaeon]